jgi:hypothetical protein
MNECMPLVLGRVGTAASAAADADTRAALAEAATW